MAGIDNLLVVCKYDRGSTYATEAQELAATAHRFGYAVRTIETANLGDWWKNTANKPRLLLETLRGHDGPLLCLDADCRILQPLDELVALLDDADLAVKHRPGNCFSALFNAAVLLVRRTPATLGVLDTWARRGEQFGSLHRFVEQGAFAEGLLYSQGTLVCRELPERFHTMHDRDGGAPPASAAIIHLKVSRRERHSALPPDHRPPAPQAEVAGHFVTLRPRRTVPPSGLPMNGIDGAIRDYQEYASRFGIASSGSIQAAVAEGDLCGLEAHHPAAAAELSRQLPAESLVVLSDYDTIFLRDPGVFTDALAEADVAVAWDRRDRGALPSLATWAFRAGPRLEALWPAWQQALARAAAGDPLAAPRGLAEVLRGGGPWRVATLLSECVADVPHAGRDTVVLANRGQMRLFHRGPSLHPHSRFGAVPQRISA